MTPIQDMSRHELAEEALRIKREQKVAAPVEADRLTTRYKMVVARIRQLDREEDGDREPTNDRGSH